MLFYLNKPTDCTAVLFLVPGLHISYSNIVPEEFMSGKTKPSKENWMRKRGKYFISQVHEACHEHICICWIIRANNRKEGTRVTADTGIARLMQLCSCQYLWLLSIMLDRQRTLVKTAVAVKVYKCILINSNVSYY